MKKHLKFKFRPFERWPCFMVSIAVVSLFCSFVPQVAAQTILSSVLMHQSNTTFRAANDRMTHNFMYYDTLGSGNNCVAGRSAWINYVGRHSKLENDPFPLPLLVPLVEGLLTTVDNTGSDFGDDFNISSDGVQIGIDLISNKCTQFGIMFGYEEQKSTITPMRTEWYDNFVAAPFSVRLDDQIKAKDYYFGLYGAKRFADCWDLRGSIGYGKQSYDMIHRVVGYFDGPIVIGGIIQIPPGRYSLPLLTNSFDGNTLEANIELGRQFRVGQCMSLRPVVGLDFFHNRIEASNETLLIIDLIHYDKIKFNQAYVRIGSDVQWNFRRLNILSGVYYLYDFVDDDLKVGANLLDQLSTNLHSCDLGNSVISLKIGGQYYLNRIRTLSAYCAYNADIYVDRDSTPVAHTGAVGLRWVF